MNESRVKSKEFWEQVKSAIDQRGDKSVAEICKEFSVTASGYNYAGHRFGWIATQTKKFPAKKAKFVKYVPESSTNGLITIKKGEIEITIRDTESLKKVLEVL